MQKEKSLYDFSNNPQFGQDDLEHQYQQSKKTNHKWPKDQSSDSTLWRAFKQGDEAAFAAIYRTNFQALYNYGAQFSQDRELVKDSIQDMFVELRIKRAHMIDTDSIKPFLFTILRRRILRYLKKESNKVGEIGQTSDHLFPVEVSHEQTLINKQLDEESLSKLRIAINKLSINEREAIFHFYFENHSYQQIADIMGFEHVKSARSLVYKALAVMKRHIDLAVIFLLSIQF